MATRNKERDEGQYFNVTKSIRVCSRRFREGDIKKSLSGKNELKNGVVPSVSPWIRTSPRKRKELMERHFEEAASKSASRKLSSSVVVMEELSNEMVPGVSDLSSQFENVETQTDLTEHEAYLTEIIDNKNKRIYNLEQKN